MDNNTSTNDNKAAATATTDIKKSADFIVQYIILRKDLNWPLGAMITQCCHASTAAMHLYSNDEITQEYFSNLDNMHKIVLGIENLSDLENLNKKLLENNVKFKLWIEQPENIPTSLATKPYRKKEIEKLFKKFKLFK
jgi:peptidyl-tRNA hydrolase